MQITLDALLATKTNIEQQKAGALQLVQQADGALALLSQLIVISQTKEPVSTDKNGTNVLGVQN